MPEILYYAKESTAFGYINELNRKYSLKFPKRIGATNIILITRNEQIIEHNVINKHIIDSCKRMQEMILKKEMADAENKNMGLGKKETNNDKIY